MVRSARAHDFRSLFASSDREISCVKARDQQARFVRSFFTPDGRYYDTDDQLQQRICGDKFTRL